AQTAGRLRETGISTQVEPSSLPELTIKQRFRPSGVATDQIEDEPLEIRCLGNVHRGARRFESVGPAPNAIRAGAEKLVEHVVLVGCNDQAGYWKPHHARNMPGADVSEVS